MDAAKDFVAGTVGGVAGLLVGQPFDVLRIRAQTVWVDRPGNLVGHSTDMLRREGVQALFKGVIPPMFGVGLQNAVLFFAYGSAMRMLTPSGDEATASLSAVTVAGSIGGLACAFVTGPVELLKVRQQVNESRGGIGTMSLMKSMITKDGASGVFRGLSATFARDIPSYGIYFWSYEYMRRAYANAKGISVENLPGFINFMAGGIGGSVSWAAIYPIDVVKSRLQAKGEGTLKEGFFQCARRIYAQEGIRVFGRGLGLTLARAFPVNAAIFYFYEVTMKALNITIPKTVTPIDLSASS